MGASGYDGFLTRIALPGNGLAGLPTTWSARWCNVALVAADANDVSTEITRNNGVSGGGQDAWLERTLAGLRGDPAVDWIVVGFHHCAYCTNTLHGSDAGVRRWAPLFDRYGVDLVINGHNHCYERTHPVRAEAPVAEVALEGDEPEAPAAEDAEASIEADAVDPTHQGPGDSEGHTPYAPEEAEEKQD